MNNLRKATLESARQAATNIGLAASAARIASLILLAKLVPNKDNYSFSVSWADQERIAPNFALGLRDKDAFLMSRFSLGILSVPIVDGVEVFSAAAPIYWPDPNVFNAAGAGAANLSEAQALESLYNGFIQLTTNTDVRLEDFHLGDLRTVKTTQDSDVTSNEQDGCQYLEIGNLMGFHGFEKNKWDLRIDSPDKTLLGGPDARNNYIVLKADGAIVKGATTALFRQN